MARRKRATSSKPAAQHERKRLRNRSDEPYRLSREALEDLGEIDDFIARRSENPSGADVVQRYLFQAFERIGADPSRCRGEPWPHVTSLPVKFLTVRKYVVIYDDTTIPVGIVAVAGARQDLAQLLNTDKRYAKLARGT